MTTTKTLRSRLRDFLLCKNIHVQRVGVFERSILEIFYRCGGFRFLQIGGYDGVSHDNLYWYVNRYKGRGVVVEPLLDAFQRLESNYEWMPSVRAVRAAVHPNLTQVELFRVLRNEENVPAWAYGTTSVSKDWLLSRGIPDASIIKETVPGRTLMEIMRENNLVDLDLLQIDTEGFDHEVLRMLDLKTSKPRIIKYEHTKYETEDFVRMELEMVSYLEGFGYQVHKENEDMVATLRNS